MKKRITIKIEPLTMVLAVISINLALAVAAGQLQRWVSFAGIGEETGFFLLTCISAFAFGWAAVSVETETTP